MFIDIYGREAQDTPSLDQLLFILTLCKTNYHNQEVFPIQLVFPGWRHLCSIGGLHHRHQSIYLFGEQSKDSKNLDLNQISCQYYPQCFCKISPSMFVCDLSFLPWYHWQLKKTSSSMSIVFNLISLISMVVTTFACWFDNCAFKKWILPKSIIVSSFYFNDFLVPSQFIHDTFP
jgi:hypothetical protein